VRDFALARFSPRPKRRGAIRKYFYQASVEYIENQRGRLESRARDAEVALEFQNADRAFVNVTDSFEYLPRPFAIARGINLPVGSYPFRSVTAGYNLGQQRVVAANLSVEHGTFYSGHKTTVTIGRGRAKVTNQISAEPTYSYNHVTLAEGEFTTHLLGSRVTYTLTPLMFVSALLQYNSGTSSVSTNARLRWEYLPGSELFVVYNDERSTLTRALPSNRAFIVKVNRLFRF
jgi:hypothetical protein